MPKRVSCGSVLPGRRPSKYLSINSLAVHCCTSPACRDAHRTIFGFPLSIESSSRPLLGRCPTSRDFVPWRFSAAGPLSAWRDLHCGGRKPCMGLSLSRENFPTRCLSTSPAAVGCQRGASFHSWHEGPPLLGRAKRSIPRSPQGARL